MHRLTELPGDDRRPGNPRVPVRSDGNTHYPSLRYPPVAPHAAGSDDQDDVAALLEYLRIFWRHKWTLAASLVLGLVAALTVSLSMTPMYRATATLEIQDVQDPLSPFLASDPSYETQIQLLLSQTMRNRTVSTLSLAEGIQTEAAEEIVDPLSGVRSLLRLPTPGASISYGQAVSRAARNLAVNNPKNSAILTLRTESPDPQAAADFVNTLSTEYMKRTDEQRFAAYNDTTAWLAREEEQLKKSLEESEQAMADFARASGLVFMDETTNISQERLRQLQAQLSNAENERSMAESAYRASLGSPTEALPEVLDSGPMQGYEADLTNLKRELALLSATLTPAHYRVQEVQAQIEALEAARDGERTNIIRRLKIEYESRLAHEQQLRRDFEAQSALLADQSDTMTQYNILRREVETNRALYEQTLTQGKEASIASGMGLESARIVDPATVPLSPRSPNLPLNLALGLVGGLGMGAGVVVLRSRSDTRIQVLGALSPYFDVRELGVIPSAKTDPDIKVLTRRAGGKPRSDVVSGLLFKKRESAAPEESLELVTSTRKQSVLAEAFRATMASILFAGENGNRPRVLVFTSPLPKEGKSAVVSNVAIAMAEINQRVLIIDGDMRLPRLHTTFELSNTYGLSDLLHQRQPIEPEGEEVFARSTSIPGLSVLTAGPARPSPARLLHSPRLKELIERFRGEFDTILIDSPPVLSVSDSRVLAQVADSVILVVRAHQTSQDAAFAAIRLFVEDGTPVLGTVLNDWNPKASAYGNSSYANAYESSYYHNV